MSGASSDRMKKLFLEEIPSLLRLHIVGVALLATLVFGYVFTGRYAFELVPFVAIDWFIINLTNRVTDIEEDLANDVPGAHLARDRRRVLLGISVALFVGSFAVSHLLVSSALTPLRLVVQVIGFAYNYRVVPWRGKWTRWKELYFWKNGMSALIFVMTCIVYPLAMVSYVPVVSWAAIVAVTVFFVLFELSYEVLYDFRDLEGDAREGVPTYPVVHGPIVARKIVDGLVVSSGVVLVTAFFARLIGVRELLMVVAPLSQWIFYRRKMKRGLTHADCVAVTHLGSMQLCLFLVGTYLWARAGLPENVFL